MACSIYSIYNPTPGPLEIYYNDCNSGATSTTVSADSLIYRCIFEITNPADGLVITDVGPCTDCLCRTVQNTGESNGKFYYVDCDNNLQLTPIVGVGNYIQVCAKVLSFDDGGSWATSNGGACTDNKCPCKCYYTVADTESSTIVRYFNCDSVATAQEILPNSGLYKTCGTFDIVGTLYDSGSLCVSGNCPTFFCQCYTVTNNGLNSGNGVVYLNCDSQIVTQIINPTETYTFCALNVLYYLTTANPVVITPNFPESFSVTNSGDCFNGQCEQSLSIEDQLLLDILAKYGPCPDICDGTTPVGGPNGTDITDIKTGLVL
jgi:hypothetical protein